MEPICISIFNALVQRRGINLPGIGSLHVKREEAYMRTKHQLIPAVNRVVFSPVLNPDWSNIEQLVAASNSIEPESFATYYDGWVEGCRTEHGLTIPGVGSIHGNHFTPSPELNALLNPDGTAPIVLRRRGSVVWNLLLWAFLALAIGGAIAWGVVYYMEWREVKEAQEQTITIKTPISASAPTPKPATDSTAAALTSPVPTATPPAVTAPPKGEVLYHVVGGVFSTEANANKYIAKLDKSRCTPVMIPYPGQHFMVSLFASPDEATTTAKMRELRSLESSVWVYKQRGR